MAGSKGQAQLIATGAVSGEEPPSGPTHQGHTGGESRGEHFLRTLSARRVSSLNKRLWCPSEPEARGSSTQLCPCQVHSFTQDFVHSGLLGSLYWGDS